MKWEKDGCVKSVKLSECCDKSMGEDCEKKAKKRLKNSCGRWLLEKG